MNGERMLYLKKAGFVQLRQSGSHMVLQHPDGREVVVPIHAKPMKRATMFKIIKQTGFTQVVISPLASLLVLIWWEVCLIFVRWPGRSS